MVINFHNIFSKVSSWASVNSVNSFVFGGQTTIKKGKYPFVYVMSIFFFSVRGNAIKDSLSHPGARYSSSRHTIDTMHEHKQQQTLGSLHMLCSYCVAECCFDFRHSTATSCVCVCHSPWSGGSRARLVIAVPCDSDTTPLPSPHIHHYYYYYIIIYSSLW